MDLIEKTYALCNNIILKKPERFSGIGLVAYNTEFDKKSHCDLRPHMSCPQYSVDNDELIDYLIEISYYQNTFHDGFHMINENGILTHVAQYFVPPIVEGFMPNQAHGVRLYSGLCGSTIKGVLFIAVICSDESIYIFRNGELYKHNNG